MLWLLWLDCMYGSLEFWFGEGEGEVSCCLWCVTSFETAVGEGELSRFLKERGQFGRLLQAAKLRNGGIDGRFEVC